MIRFKMYNMHFLQLILLLIFDSVNGNMECDCNTIAAVQEVMQKELFQIKVENSKMASRLRRLEASSKNSKTMDHQHSETASDMTKDLDPSHDKTKNDIKRIETIESTLAIIVPQFESYVQNKTDDINHRIHAQRIDKIEFELALVSNKTDNFLDMNDDSENAMAQLHRTIKRTLQGEKIKRLNLELEMNEKVKNIEDYSANFTRTSGQLIDEFMKENAIENKEFTAEMNQGVINLNNTINDYKIDMESSFDDLKNDLKLEMNEKIKKIEDYCVNLTITSGQLIDEFKNEVAIENKEFAAKMDKKEININNAINDHKIDVESSFDDLQNGLELDMNEKIKNIEDFCENFTITSGQLIDEFKKEVAIENKEFTDEINRKVVKIYDNINDHKINVDSSFFKTKRTLSNLENIILKDRTDGGWSGWGSFTSCSATCGRGIMMRSRTCTHPKPSLKGKVCEGSPVQIAVCYRNSCPVCSLEEVDLVIIIDASTSVTAPQFPNIREFCKDIVDLSGVDSGSARIGVLIYSTDVQIQFHLNEYNTTAAMKAAIDKIPYIYGSTNTADAIMTMYSRMFTRSNGDRHRVPNVGIVVTDGISNINSKRTIPEANNARTKDIELYAIGVGLTDTRELDAIANTPTDMFRFNPKKFDELAGLAETIFGDGCGKPTTIEKAIVTTKQPGCSLAEEVDLVINIDASTSVTQSNFQKMLDFCKDLVDYTDVDSGNARIGVLIYSTYVEIQFHLNEFNTTAAVKAAIDKIPYIYGSTNTADAIMTMYSRMFTKSKGDRPGVQNVGIVVTDGISNINSKRTIPEANNARTKDIELYAIGIGLTDTKELDAIANAPTYRFSFPVETFEELAGLANTIFCDGFATSAPDL